MKCTFCMQSCKKLADGIYWCNNCKIKYRRAKPPKVTVEDEELIKALLREQISVEAKNTK